MQELTRTIIKSSTDSPQIFRLALHSARVAGLSETGQIRVASAVVDLFFFSHFAEGVLVFQAGHDDQHQPVLRVLMEHTGRMFETIVPFIPSPVDLSNELSTKPVEFISQTTFNALQQHSRDMEQFTFALSHELKNSLTKLKLAVSLLEEDDDPKSMQRHIGIIQRSSGQLDQTLNDLNKIIEVRHGSPIAQPLNIAAVFSGVYEDLQDKILAAQATVSTDFGGISDWNYVEIYLQSMFSNLLSNSLKYTYANRRPEIAIKATKNGKELFLTVSDNGQGIDLNRFRKTLFTPFSRFSSMRQEGKGLGLFIIKSMIERNGGTIEVDSVPDQGTTFTLKLREYRIDQ